MKNLNTNIVDVEMHYWVNIFDKRYSGLEIKLLAQTQILKAFNNAEVDMPANIIELKKCSK